MHQFCLFVFFSSRRRHTRFKCDWSSYVCSSDLAATAAGGLGAGTSNGLDGSADGKTLAAGLFGDGKGSSAGKTALTAAATTVADPSTAAKAAADALTATAAAGGAQAD